ncbi:MAG TPA: helix-turn-helix domain-containing protein [Prolixibacteraceae bacterium]|nr:helix-turn-helix domain-containing protein [Prolixibacteraceae bacterium]
MQELLTIISSIKRDIELLGKSMDAMKKTHAQYLSEEWITSDQAMKILKICPRTLNSLKSSGKLPYSKVQGTIYIRTVDIENLLKQNYISPFSAKTYSTAKADSNDR